MSVFSAPDRRLDWPGCRNVRDLGGLPTVDGGVIRAGALIRADALDRLDPDGLAAFGATTVSLILDLRNPGEAELPHPFAGDPRYRAIPLIDPRRERTREQRRKRTLGMIYSDGLERNARTIVQGMTAIADAPDGAVVVHCAVGKDRTGIIVALLLSAAGVADEVIAEDYALTAECLREEFAEILDTLEGAERAHVQERLGALPETILEMLSHLREQYGDAERYLLAQGLGEDRLKRLRERLRAD